jgi:hypothetical protein
MKRRRMDRNVLNFELSSAAFSTCAFAGVEAREGSFELTADVVAAGSAMMQAVSRGGEARGRRGMQSRTGSVSVPELSL